MGDDFYQYWAVPRSVSRWGPVENVYSEPARKRISADFIAEANTGKYGNRFIAVANRRQDFEAYQSPFLYLLMRPLARFDFETAYRAYQSISLLLFVSGVIGCARLLGLGMPVALLASALATSWFEPCWSDIRVGNSNRLILAAIAMYLWMRRRSPGRGRDIAGGVVLGCALMFKPVVIFVIPLLALWRGLNRRFGEIAWEWVGIAITGAGAFTFSTMAFGNQWFHWVEAVRSQPDKILRVEQGNIAMAMLIRAWLGADVAMVLAGVPGLIAAIVIVLAHRRTGGARTGIPRDAFGEEAIIVAVGLLLYLLSMRLVWPHYFILAIPACLFLLGRHRGMTEGRGRIRVWSAVAAIWLMLSVSPLMFVLDFSNLYAIGVLMALAVLILFALLLVQLAAMTGGANKA